MTRSSLRALTGAAWAAATFTLVGSAVASKPRIQSQFQALSAPGKIAFDAGAYEESARLFEKSFQAALRLGDINSALILRSNYAGAELAQFQYRKARDAYLQARDLAVRHGTNEDRSIIEANLTSLYTVLGDLELADQAARAGLKEAGASDPHGYRYKLLAAMGLLRAKQGAAAESASFFRQAILAADAKGNTAAMATDWDHFGEELLLKGDYQAAETALVEAFRLRTLLHDRNLRTSLVKLAWLRLSQGDLRSAESLMNSAVALRATDSGLPPWFVAYLQGRILEKRGLQTRALQRFSEALQSAREWQIEAAPSGIVSEYAQTRLNELYRDLVNTSFAAHSNLALEAFTATEADRASSLEQLLINSKAWRERLTPEYWSTLALLRKARASDMTLNTPESRSEIARLQENLAEITQKSTLGQLSTVRTIFSENNTAGTALSSIQAGIRPGEALLSFHVGDAASALWAVTRGRIQLYRLPPRKNLEGPIRRFREAIRSGAPERDQLGKEVYGQLFGGLHQEFREKSLWIISAEETFFEVPFSALVSEFRDGKPLYLIEQHAILHTPSAALLKIAPEGRPAPEFVGVGDGIYNSADPRWRSVRFRVWTRPSLELPRLAGSKPEIEACARAWNPQQTPVLLTGGRATRPDMESLLTRRPAIVHFAAHVLTPPQRKNEAAIDLGLTPEGQPDLLTKEDIESMQVSGATVVMSGCSSGAAASVPTAGVLGLTRAWLAAGAHVVVGSRWPTPDDNGGLFRSFYRHLGESGLKPSTARAAAEALNQARLDMFHSGSWRSDPKYWSAFYILGKE